MDFIGKYAKLNQKEQEIRLGMLDWCLENGGELPYEEARKIVQMVLGQTKTVEDAEEILMNLEARHYFRCTEEKSICYLYPYSAYPTAYHVFLEDGRSFYAMCAIDAMGSAVTFHQPIHIESSCKDSKEKLVFDIDPEKGFTLISPDDQLFASYYDTVSHYQEFNC